MRWSISWRFDQNTNVLAIELRLYNRFSKSRVTAFTAQKSLRFVFLFLACSATKLFYLVQKKNAYAYLLWHIIQFWNYVKIYSQSVPEILSFPEIT